MTATAPVAVVAAYRTDCRLPEFAHIDMSKVMENLCLETDAQVLGGVWIGTAPNENRMKAVEDAMDMPSGIRAFAVFPFGYPAESRAQQERFDEHRIHWL
ncbi:MAG: nitroreductase family protein [Spirochaetales bacterium]|nr:nitroreductase family protein [Spirochaetales bacterium]